MAKSSVSRCKNKPKKPYPDFPLFPHATGRWAKKIRGKFHYFGKWDDADAALQKYLDQKDDLHAGRTPRVTGDGLTVVDLCNRFLTAKRRLLDTGELSPRTWRDYYDTCAGIVEQFGKRRLVADFTADDFEGFHSVLAKKRGPVALGNEIQRVRSVFKFGFEAGLIETPVRFGPGFKKPNRKTIRQARQKNGKRMFEAEDIRAMLDVASQPMKAMILLGVNCAFGQTDIARLPIDALDFEIGWIDYPRPKTAVERCIPLWSDTLDALREALDVRPKATNKDNEKLVFLTKQRHPWVRTNEKGTPIDSVGLQFGKLLRGLGLKRNGLNFYAIRHTFETIAGESRDQVAVNAIMGHVDNSMAGVYRERISDERLWAVVDVVRAWLWPPTEWRKSRVTEKTSPVSSYGV